MRPVALSDEIAVGEMPGIEDISILYKAGFRALLNVQPDGEVARFADSAATKAAADTTGLSYAYVPIESRLPSERQIADFSEALASLPRPIYAFCYSGGRASAVWALAKAPVMPPDQIVTALEAAGYDASTLRSALARRHAGLPAFEVTQRAPTALPPHAENGAAPSEQPASEPPTIQAPKAQPALVTLPRAATAGGFAVPG